MDGRRSRVRGARTGAKAQPAAQLENGPVRAGAGAPPASAVRASDGPGRIRGPGLADRAPAAAPAEAESLGELEFGGSLLLKIKDKIKQARPLFHLLLFFFPALVFALLAGRWRSVVLQVYVS